MNIVNSSRIDEWRHVPTDQNPADLGSRGGPVQYSSLWWNGPEWLQHRDAWPPILVTSVTPESRAEAKVIQEVLAATTVETETDDFDELLGRHDLRRTLRVCTWVTRFIRNCLQGHPRATGPLTTAELEYRTKWWIRRVQSRAVSSPKFLSNKLQLNLQHNTEGIHECRGRIQGHYPVFLPDDSSIAAKYVKQAHYSTLHGGVGLTMACICENHWVPHLRQLM